MGAEKRTLTYIDLFAGAGGLSEGFSSMGFTPIAHIEMSRDACKTLLTRACYYYLKDHSMLEKYREYLRGQITTEELYKLVPETVRNSVICETMSKDSMKSIYSRIDGLIAQNRIAQVDLVIGGPPCQAYSQVGRSRKCMDNDPRNELYKLYFQILNRYMPSAFVFENVPGLITAGEGEYLKDILETFGSLGYAVHYEILNASDFGVMQNRRRIILVGWKKVTKRGYPKFAKVSSNYTVNEILQDLPTIEPGKSSDQYKDEPIGDYLKSSEIRKKDDVLTWHVARTNIDRDRKIYKLAIAAWNDNKKRLNYSALPPELITHKNTKGFLDRYKVVAADLPTSHTMMAHISKDGHYYIHPDIAQARSISVREAARIQSFPDDFYFEGSRTSAFVQIGNAVPPLMATAIAAAIRKQFCEEDDNE